MNEEDDRCPDINKKYGVRCARKPGHENHPTDTDHLFKTADKDQMTIIRWMDTDPKKIAEALARNGIVKGGKMNG